MKTVRRKFETMEDTDMKTTVRYDARDFLEALIDDYRYGKITAEECCMKAEEFLDTYRADNMRDDDLRTVVEVILPETIRAFKDSSADEKQKKLAFWKGLKDCDYMLAYGNTFSEEIEEYLREGFERRDPVEYSDRYLEIEPELERLIREETGEGGYFGYCHTYWRCKKQILKERYGIDWKSPSDRYPGVMFD